MKLKKMIAAATSGMMAFSLMSSMGVNMETVKADDKEVTISMMIAGTATENDFETEQLPELVKKAYPNINLEVTKLPDNQYLTSLKTKLVSGECPDIIWQWPAMSGTGAVQKLAEAGYLEPLSDLECMKTAGEAATEQYTYEGEIYGMPNGISVLGTFYNKKLFEENNLSEPKTWDEFLNCCEVLKEAGIQPIVMGDKDMYEMQFGLYQVAANTIYDENPDFDEKLWSGETKFTDEGTWDVVMEMYISLYDNGYISDTSLGLGEQQAIQQFIDGEAAMIFDGSFNYPAINAKGSMEFERGCFPLPGANEDIIVSASMGASPAIYSGSEYIEECKEILNTWFDGESDIWKAYVDAGKIIPTYGYGTDSVDEIFQPFLKLHNEGKTIYWCNQKWPGGTENEMEALLSKYIGGQGITVDEIVEGMQTKLDELKGE